MTLKPNTRPVIVPEDPALVKIKKTLVPQSPLVSSELPVGNTPPSVLNTLSKSTSPVKSDAVPTDITSTTEFNADGTLYITNVTQNTNNQFFDVTCGGGISVGIVDSSNVYTNITSATTKLGFDTDSGFDVTDLGGGLAKIGMNSTFKCWEVNGSSGLIACGLDTVNFVAGTGITITSDNTAVPKTLTINSAGGVAGCNTQVQFNNSGSLSGDTGLTYNCTTKTVVLCNIAAPAETDIKISTYSDDSTWYATYGDGVIGSSDESGTGIAYDSLGNVYVIGQKSSTEGSFLLKYNNKGTLVWQKYFSDSTSSFVYGNTIFIDSNDNIYCTVQIYDDPRFEYILLKLDTDGAIIWQFKNITVDSDYIRDVTVDNIGNIIFNVHNYNSTISKIFKLDSSGLLVWSKSYDGTTLLTQENRSIICDSTNNIYLTIRATVTGLSYGSLTIMKLDPLGNVVWAKRTTNVNVGIDNQGTEISIDSNDNLYVYYGITSSNSPFPPVVDGGNLTCLLKFDSSGNLLWERYIDRVFDAFGVQVDASDNVYISSVAYDTTNTDNYVVMKYDTSGNLIWQRLLDHINGQEYFRSNQYGNQLAIHNDKFAVTGYLSAQSGSQPEEAFIGQFNTDGSGTGTYGDIRYEQSYSRILSDSVLTFTSETFTTSTITESLTISTLTIQNASNSSTTYTMSGADIDWKFKSSGNLSSPYYKLPVGSGLKGQVLTMGNNNCATWCCLTPNLSDYFCSFIVRPYSDSCIFSGEQYGSIGIGMDSLLNAGGNSNIALGMLTLVQSQGNHNIALGDYALCSNVCGNYNIGIGMLSLAGNTTGQNNIGIGWCAGSGNTSGNNSVYIGNSAGSFVLTGTNNTVIGNLVGSAGMTCTVLIGAGSCERIRANQNRLIINSFNTEILADSNSNYNFGLGVSNLLNTSASSGYYNVAIGWMAGMCSGCASSNVYVGSLSGKCNLTGSHNIGIGPASLFNLTDGFVNIGIGCSTLFCSTSGRWNIAIGAAAGYWACGESNVMIGKEAGFCSTCGTNNVNIGYEAGYYGSGSQNNIIGYQAGKGAGGCLSCNNNFMGTYAGYCAYGSNNIGIGCCAGYLISCGNNNTIIGSLPGTLEMECTVLIGAGTCERIKVNNTGLYINGSCWCSGTGSGGVSSLNTLTGALTLSGGTNVTIGTSGSTLTICSTASGATLDAYCSFKVGNGLASSTGTDNVAIGFNTLCSNTSGASNIAIGSDNLRNNQTGFSNFAYGIGNLCQNINGSCNLAIGQANLRVNTGSGNIGIGRLNLCSNTTGTENYAFGLCALFSNTTGNFNIAIGSKAMAAACYSTYNIGIGNEAGQSITTGTANTVIGALPGTAGMVCTVLIGAGTCERIKVDNSGLCINGASLSTSLVGDGLSSDSVGFRIVPQNSQSADYVLVASDSAKHILHPAADTSARTFTIPANGSVAWPVGTTLSIINQNGAGTITIAINSDTMRLAGAGTTGSRTLAANGMATAVKIASTEWIISGVGLT